jgi:hypothetical protein
MARDFAAHSHASAASNPAPHDIGEHDRAFRPMTRQDRGTQIDPFCAAPSADVAAATSVQNGGYARCRRTLSQLRSVNGRGRHVLPPQTRHWQGLARVTVTSIDRCRSVLTESCRKITG